MELEFTGERVVPGMAITYGVIEHLHRYAVAREFSGGRTVLDIALGEGYGTSLLAAVAAFAYGVDISSDVVRHARAKYSAPNLCFLVGEATAIPSMIAGWMGSRVLRPSSTSRSTKKCSPSFAAF